MPAGFLGLCLALAFLLVPGGGFAEGTDEAPGIVGSMGPGADCRLPLRDTPVGEALASIEQEIGALVGSGALPGLAIAVVSRDGVLGARAWGVADRRSGEPLTSSHRFPAGALGDVLLSMVAWRAAAEGKVSLDARVEEVFPSVRSPEGESSGMPGPTLRHLLAHTSGLRYPLALRDLAPWTRVPSEEKLATVDSVRTFGPPGTLRSADRSDTAIAQAMLRAAGVEVEAAAGALVGAWSDAGEEVACHVRRRTRWKARACEPTGFSLPVEAWGRVLTHFVDLAPAGGGAAVGPSLLADDILRAGPFGDPDGSAPGGWNVRSAGLYGELWEVRGESKGSGAVLMMLPDRHLGVVLLSNGGDEELLASLGQDLLLRTVDALGVDAPVLGSRGRLRPLRAAPKVSLGGTSAEPPVEGSPGNPIGMMVREIRDLRAEVGDCTSKFPFEGVELSVGMLRMRCERGDIDVVLPRGRQVFVDGFRIDFVTIRNRPTWEAPERGRVVSPRADE